MKAALSITATLALGLAMSSLSAHENATAAPTAAATEAVAPAPQAVVSLSLPKEITDKVGLPEPGKALVVFFRPKKFMGAAIGFKVRENDVELGKLRNGNFFVLQVEPGKHTYVVHSETKDITPIEAEDGETYFMMGEMTMGIMAGRPNLSPSTAVNFQAEVSKLKPSKPLE